MNFLENNRLNVYSDATLRTEDGRSFQIHKFWLAKNCRYFYELFCSDVENNDILIPNIKGEVMGNILSFLYTGKIEVTNENIIELMKASYDLDLNVLNLYEKNFIKMNLSVENCVNIYITARKINRYDILRICYRFLQVNFERIIYSRDTQFENLDTESFETLLKDRNLCVSSEKVVHFAITQWVKSDFASCLPLMPELLSCLALADIDESLATEILKHDSVSSNPSCEGVYWIRHLHSKFSNLQILNYYLEFQEDIELFRDHRLPSKLNFIARYYHTANETTSFEIYLTYDDKFDLWRKILDSDLECGKIVCAGDVVYCFETNENTNCRYNILEREWFVMNELIVPRYNYDVLVSEDQVFVLGGTSSTTGDEVYDVEIYNTLYYIWYRTRPMIPVSCFASVALEDSVYVIGYKLNDTGSDMVCQIYDKRSETWTLIPAVSIKRSHFALITYFEKIYVIGGINENNHLLKDVEVFDPLENKWKTEVNLPHAYYNPKAVTIDYVLIVFDNDLRDREYLNMKPPVFWNIDKQRWDIFEKSSPMNKLQLYDFFSIEETRVIKSFTKENRHSGTHFDKSPFF